MVHYNKIIVKAYLVFLRVFNEKTVRKSEAKADKFHKMAMEGVQGLAYYCASGRCLRSFGTSRVARLSALSHIRLGMGVYSSHGYVGVLDDARCAVFRSFGIDHSGN